MTDSKKEIPFDDFMKNLKEGPFDQKLPSKLSKTDQKISNAFNRFGVNMRKIMSSKEIKQALFDSSGFNTGEKIFFKRLTQLHQAGRLKRFPG